MEKVVSFVKLPVMFGVLIAVAANVLFAAGSYAMEVKLKSVKCILLAPEVASIEKCFIKAISRNTSTLNIFATLKGTFGPPIYVNFSINKKNQILI